jgi:hypothetical protein
LAEGPESLSTVWVELNPASMKVDISGAAVINSQTHESLFFGSPRSVDHNAVLAPIDAGLGALRPKHHTCPSMRDAGYRYLGRHVPRKSIKDFLVAGAKRVNSLPTR